MMFKRGGWNNRGQFFLLAAVIIITGIVAIASVKTFISEPGGSAAERIYDLRQELGSESGRVIDFGIFNQTYDNALIENWIEVYTNYTRDREGVSEWLFVYGNLTEMKVINITAENRGNIGLSLGDRRIQAKAKPVLVKYSKSLGGYAKHGTKINVKDTLGIDREFTLKEGENFYFVVAKISEGETIIQRNDEEDDD